MTTPEKSETNRKILDLSELTVAFRTPSGPLVAVDRISFSINRGEVLALVGESGCGKSATSLAIMQLLPPVARIVSGKVYFDGVNLAELGPREMDQIRGRRIGIVFQEPMTSLNPVMPIGAQISESYRVHTGADRKRARERALDLMQRVGIREPAQRVDDYPHQLSGGMRQRVMIAIALAADPALLIADEPTTALDVTVQAQILDLLLGLGQSLGLSILLITHDLAVVAQTAQRVAVMYAGRIVEEASARDLFSSPQHPYTRGLLGSLPRYWKAGERLPGVEGTVPRLDAPRHGCLFYERCGERLEKCRGEVPALLPVHAAHSVACHLYPDSGGRQI